MVLLGIDEAGRGALSGPVSLGGVLLIAPLEWSGVPGLKDSKKLSEKAREKWYAWLEEKEMSGELLFYCALRSAHDIDTLGIVPSCRSACIEIVDTLTQAYAQLRNEITLSSQGKVVDRALLQNIQKEISVRLDAGLQLPNEWTQESIVKGDEKEVSIALASIVAKVTRDRHMIKLSEDPQYAPYHFEIHKGYGTLAHRQSIEKHGKSPEHRLTFCKNIKSVV
jgi:ribonuclease HII